ncbi:MAG: hypothetical protein R3B72_31665 [Polyangiaceae bacterium]
MRTLIAIVLSVGVGTLTAFACSVGGDGIGGFGGGYGGNSSGTGAGDADIDVKLGDGGGGMAGFDLSAYCAGDCIPLTGERVMPGCDPGTAGAGGDTPSDGGAGGAGGAGGGGGGPGFGGSAPVDYDCKLVPDRRVAQGVCVETGTVNAGQSCLTAHDCAPGFGCVGVGVCRPYCCGDLEACPTGTYCSLLPLTETIDRTEPLMIPVCTLATNCTLLDASTCAPGETCTIVREDGTTSCVVPGRGTIDDPCPCAADHVCNADKNKCFKLCELGKQADCPQTHICQAGSNIYPQGFGICVSQ